MSDSASSPFEEPKTNRWIWILPSVVLHVVIVLLWLAQPEKPPRQPGERKLTIDPEQAEQLQEHVEESKLEELQANVKELQAIREKMEAIRAARMAKLQAFEGNMKKEASQDMAGIVEQIAATQQKIIALHLQMEEDVRAIEAKMPEARKAMERGEAEGVRAIASLAPLQAPLLPLSDQFEELYLEITANIHILEQRLEWISTGEIHDRFVQYQATLNESKKTHQLAFSAVNITYRAKTGRIIGTVSEDPDAILETLKNFDRTVKEGKAKAERERTELQKKIDDATQEMAELKKRQAVEKEKLNTIDRRKDREGWKTQQAIVAPIDSSITKLARQLKDDSRRVNNIKFSIDRRQQQSVQRIRASMANLLKAALMQSPFEDARTGYQKVLQASEEFQAFLEGSS